MEIILVVIIMFLVCFGYAYFGRKYKTNMGRNVGEKYMKEQWGIDEDNRD